MNRNDGMPTEFEWKIYKGIPALRYEPEHFRDRIIFMSMYNGIEWKTRGNKEQCEYNSRGHWSFLGPGSEEKWYETYTDKPDGSWDRMAEEMMANFSDLSHPIFRASSAFERGESRSEGGSKKSIHFNGSHENIELLLLTVISANQLSIYGADLCNELSEDLRASEKPEAIDHLVAELRPIETWCTNTSENSRNCQKNQKLSKLSSDAGLKLVEQGQYFYTLETEERQQMQH